jgi:hypothetical protein
MKKSDIYQPQVLCEQAGCAYEWSFNPDLLQWFGKCVWPGRSVHRYSFTEMKNKLITPKGKECSDQHEPIECQTFSGCFWNGTVCNNYVLYQEISFDFADSCTNWPNMISNCLVQSMIPLPRARVGLDTTAGA